MSISVQEADHYTMRMNDYEKGLPRGRSSRHIYGRFKWFMLILLIVNVFLVYKLWDKNVQLSVEKKSAEVLVFDINQAKFKHEQSEQQLDKLEQRYNNLKSENKNWMEHIDTLKKEISTMTKRRDSAEEKISELQRELEKNEGPVLKLEQCQTELDREKDTAQKLLFQINQEKEEKQQILSALENAKAQIVANSEKTVEEQPVSVDVDDDKKSSVGVDDVAIVNVIGSDQDSEDQTEKVAEQSKTDFETEKEEIQDVDHKPEEEKDNVLIECVFTQDSTYLDKCKYVDLPGTASKWTVSQSTIIENSQENLEDQKRPYLYIDDTILHAGSDTESGIVFPEIETDQCLKMEITMLIVGTGEVKINDMEKTASGFPKRETGKTWTKEEVFFKKSDKNSHIISIQGSVPFEGAIAISDIVISTLACSQEDELNDNNEEIKEEEEEEEEAINDMVINADVDFDDKIEDNN